MTTFYIEQFGCRATQADAAAIERQLRDRGFAAASDSEGTRAEPSDTGDSDWMLRAAGAGGIGGAAGRFVGGGKFTQAGDSVAGGCNGWRSGGGIGERFCAGERAGRREIVVAARAGEDFDREYFRAGDFAGGSGDWGRGKSHAAGGEDTGRMQ